MILTIALYALAVVRITRLLQRDTITQPLRDAIFAFSAPPPGLGEQDSIWEYLDGGSVGGRVKAWWFVQRGNLGAVAPYISSDGTRKPGFIGKLVSCPDCLSVWVAGGLIPLWMWQPTVMFYVGLVSTGAAFVSFAHRLVYRD